MNIKEVLSFVASQVGGTLYEYEDGYVIECHNGTPYPTLYTYGLEGDLENTKLKGYAQAHKA